MEMPEIQSGQLRQTCDLIRTVIEDHSIELSHHQCRRAGDLLIALEGMEHATHAALQLMPGNGQLFRTS